MCLIQNSVVSSVAYATSSKNPNEGGLDHDLLPIGSPEAVAFRESFLVNLFEGFIMILDALVEGGQMRLSGTVDRAGFGHGVV